MRAVCRAREEARRLSRIPSDRFLPTCWKGRAWTCICVDYFPAGARANLGQHDTEARGAFIENDDLPARYQAAIDENIDRIADHLIELTTDPLASFANLATGIFAEPSTTFIITGKPVDQGAVAAEVRRISVRVARVAVACRLSASSAAVGFDEIADARERRIKAGFCRFRSDFQLLLHYSASFRPFPRAKASDQILTFKTCRSLVSGALEPVVFIHGSLC